MSQVKNPKVWYSSGSECRHQMELGGWFDISAPVYQQDAVTQCADDFHSNHDGWECTWPREFTIYADEHGPALATFEVEREAVPFFRALCK